MAQLTPYNYPHHQRNVSPTPPHSFPPSSRFIHLENYFFLFGKSTFITLLSNAHTNSSHQKANGDTFNFITSFTIFLFQNAILFSLSRFPSNFDRREGNNEAVGNATRKEWLLKWPTSECPISCR